LESGQAKPGAGDGKPGAWASVLASELTGDLPCMRCGYNLRGLSIREMCPECQAPVRATLLILVDPKASEFKLLRWPRLTAWGLVVWAVAALIATLGAWSIRLSELTLSWLHVAWSPDWVPWFVIGMALISGLASVVIVAPHGGVSRQERLRAAGGVLAYLPLTLLLWYLYAAVDSGKSLPVFGSGGQENTRVLVRLAIGATLALIILGLRPNARALAMRSVVVRTGRVNRQSLLALLSAVGVAALGDLLRLATTGVRGPFGQALHSSEIVLVAVGSVLVTIGLLGVTIDCWRLRPLLASPGVGITDLLDETPTRFRGER